MENPLEDGVRLMDQDGELEGVAGVDDDLAGLQFQAFLLISRRTQE